MKIMQCKCIITMIFLDLNLSLSPKVYSSLLTDRNKTPRKKVKVCLITLFVYPNCVAKVKPSGPFKAAFHSLFP